MGVEFEDEFDGVLGEGWSWMVEDPDEWSLEAAPGWLQLTATEVEHNILVRDAPMGAFEFTTAVRFRPTSNFQFAGLIVGPDQRLEDTFLQLGRAYCDPALAPDFCVGDGIYVDNLEDGEFVGTSSVAEIETDADVVFLRIVADGYSYQGYVSDDGETWELVGQHARRFGDAQIGLVNHQAFEAPAVAEFSYFTVTSPPMDDPPRGADTPIDAMVTTAVTTGTATLDQAVTGRPDAAVELGWTVEVTMDDGSIRMIPVDEDTMMEIWPDGVTAGGVRVTIEVVDGEERITGSAA